MSSRIKGAAVMASLSLEDLWLASEFSAAPDSDAVWLFLAFFFGGILDSTTKGNTQRINQ